MTKNNAKIENNEQGILAKYAQLIVNIPNLGVRTFSYGIPDELRPIIAIGQPALVSFGNQGVVNAFIVGFSDYVPEGIKVKPILEILDETPLFDIDYLNFLQWAANYYYCPLQTMIETAVPMKFIKQSKNIASLVDSCTISFDGLSADERKIAAALEKNSMSTATLQKKTKIVTSKFYTALRKLRKAGIVKVESELQEKSQKTQFTKFIKFKKNCPENKRYQLILEELKNSSTPSKALSCPPCGEKCPKGKRGVSIELEEYGNEIDLILFEKQAKTTRKTLMKLEELGCVEIFEKEVFRNPLDIYNVQNLEEFPKLTDDQQKAYKFIEKKLDENSTLPILIHGVTASGKTEVYFNAIKHTLEKGRNVLFLAPEIALASELTKRLAKRFGTENVAIWHSSISDGERYDIWERLKQDKVKVLAGARSAVFAPLANIGLIIIDEEHENSYKQNTPAPRYHAKTVAEKLAEIHKAVPVYGSATPDISSYYRALNTDNLLKMDKRFNDVKLAKVVMVDMRQEKMNGNNMLFSRTLERAINENLKADKQSIILINRRGFATITQCEACGQVVECKKCAIPMIWHASEGLLKCHYCDYTSAMHDRCSECGSTVIQSYGTGIERVEAAARKIFKDAKIARMDSDVLSGKNSHINILDDFRNGEIDILIGTQMIAKGLDNPNVTVVGVINADSSFNFPDFRSSERGFQLLTQVAGRAGRGDFEGKVYFQTSNPDFYVLDNAKNQDYLTFYNTEIEAREFFDYPPYAQLITLVLSSPEGWRANTSAQAIADKLRDIVDAKNLSEYIIVLGPSACILEKIRNEYRFQVLIKNKLRERGHSFLTSFFKQIILPEDIKFTVDVDPLDIL